MKKKVDLEQPFIKTLNNLFWPLLITFILANSFSLIDSIMLSNYDNNAAKGVATISQLQMIVGPILFGFLAGVGVYASQYFGAKDFINLKKTFGLSVILSIIFSVLFISYLAFFGDNFIGLFSDTEEIVENAKLYKNYLIYMYMLFPINFAFTFGFRITKRAKIAMYTNVLMGLINTLFNYLLIFGNFGFQELGVEGAGIATVISKGVVLVLNIIIVIIIKPEFLGKFQDMFIMKLDFAKPILTKALPIVLSESLFGLARFAYAYAFKEVGESAFHAERYATGLSFLTNSFVMATANTSSIIMGAALGKGAMQEARETAKKLVRFVFITSLGVLLITSLILLLFVQLYDIKDPILNENVIHLVRINGIFYGLRTISSSLLFIIRSGGDTLFALIIDSGVAWMIGIPLSLLAVIIFKVDLITLKFITLSESVIKVVVAFYRFRSYKWMKKII